MGVDGGVRFSEPKVPLPLFADDVVLWGLIVELTRSSQEQSGGDEDWRLTVSSQPASPTLSQGHDLRSHSGAVHTSTWAQLLRTLTPRPRT